MEGNLYRSYLKKVFWPNFCVGPLLQLLGIPQYACGLKFGPALNLNQNPFFEMASKYKINIDYDTLFYDARKVNTDIVLYDPESLVCKDGGTTLIGHWIL